MAYGRPCALTQQIARRLREDFEPLGIHVELLTAATEIDCFEEELLAASQSALSFHVLVATPEKLDLVIRNKKVSRPLALVVLDEAQNLEDEERGLRIELTLATIKRDCPSTYFLLLMPDVPNAKDLAKWLAPDSGRSISLFTGVWQPNERIVGLYRILCSGSTRRTWSLEFESLTTTPPHCTSAERTLWDQPRRLSSATPKPRPFSIRPPRWPACSPSEARASP